MTPRPSCALENLVKPLSPTRPDPLPHLAKLSPDQLLQERLLKT